MVKSVTVDGITYTLREWPERSWQDHAVWMVYDTAGELLGSVARYRSSLKIPLKGTMLRRATATRTFWSSADCAGYGVTQLQETRSEAIRRLVQ